MSYYFQPPLSFLNDICSDCDPEMSIFKRTSDVKRSSVLVQLKSLDYITRSSRPPPVEGLNFYIRERLPATLKMPKNKPTSYAEAIIKSIKTTTTSQSP